MNRKRYDTVIFDLDGTLLNTLEDLTQAVNFALRACGYPERTLSEVRGFVGNGIGKLIERALPPAADGEEEIFEQAFQAFQSFYAMHHNDSTVAYDGVLKMLETLKEAGVRLAIVSNKNDANVRALSKQYFGQWVDTAVGEREGVRRKPYPDAVLRVMEAERAQPSRTLYVGDSDVDLETARNAGIDCVAVTWGFRTEGELRRAGAQCFARRAEELVGIVLAE